MLAVEESLTDNDCDNNCEGKNLVEVYKPTVIQNGNRDSLLIGDQTKKWHWFLDAAVFTATIPLLAAGLGMSWPSPVIPKLLSEESPFGRPITTTEEAWIAAFTPLGSAIGPLAAGYYADKFGRKKALIASAVPMIIGFLITAFAKQVELYYVARFLVGIGTGSAFTVVPMYIGEIAQTHNRGKYGSSAGILITIGCTYPFSVGPYLSITIFSITCAVPLCLFIIVFTVFMPESPYYLAALGDYDQADKALRKLRHKGSDIRAELTEIKQGIEEQNQNSAGIKDLFMAPAGRKALYISVLLVSLQQLAGISPLLSYLKPIYLAAGTSISPNISTLITGAVQISSNTACIFMVERLGRKFLILNCCVFCFLSMTALGVYFYLKDHNYDVVPIFWLPITCVLIYMVTFSCGLGPLPWAVMGEILPSNVKGLAAALTTTMSFVTACLVTFLFPIVNEALGQAAGFWAFAIFCLLGYFFVHFVMFETKGKTLTEIQRILQRENR
ncbi:unnamed protein product [Ceutorhynchus assimilis]|uniref:Major facilitator superfamily (MFS) profile domain-containing protein n=1 Tax=Ceutorhynchus assimilis TaxID=467358 RepID=A0A9P0DN23_9CUCU|nr:unnamed protein product [Ceutorhynchus assimilis]